MRALLVYAGFGEGHKQAALSLKDLLKAPGKDILDFSPLFIKKLFSSSYIFITEYLPFFWKIIFIISKNRLLIILIEKIQYIIFWPFLEYIKAQKPQIVVTTHFFPPYLLNFLKEKINFKVVSIVTDMRVHPLWVNKCVDFYFVACREGERDLVELGVDKEKIICGFFPLRRGFLEELPPEYLRKKLSLDTKPCILFVSSSRGRLPFLREAIGYLKDNFNIIVIYGGNRQLRDYLKKLASPSVIFFSFYKEFWELVSLSSVIVSKPGGLTVFEGIYKKKPFVFTHYIAGQEKGNMDLLIKCGAGKLVKRKEELLEAIDYFTSKKDYSLKYPIHIRDISDVLEKVVSKLLSN